MKKLVQLKFLLPENIVEPVSDLIMGLEAQSVSHEPKDTLISELNSYFETDVDIKKTIKTVESFISYLQEDSGEEIGIQVSWKHIDSKSWEKWKTLLKKVKASPRIVITPPWENCKSAGNEYLIEINPSVAFGTGHHETTTLCIKFIDEIFAENEINTVLDVGCGSGILGICAVKLGADIAVCIDNDFKAARETFLNSLRNKVEKKIYPLTGFLHSVNSKFDLVVSNIYAETLIDLKEEFQKRISDNGLLVLSGITIDKKNKVIDHYNSSQFKLISEKIDGDWAGLLFKYEKYNHG